MFLKTMLQIGLSRIVNKIAQKKWFVESSSVSDKFDGCGDYTLTAIAAPIIL